MSYLDKYVKTPEPSPTRYAMLHGRRRETEKKLYHGMYRGREVSFEPVFRGKQLSQEECMALCDGLVIPVQGLSRTSYDGKLVRYGASVKLDVTEQRGLQRTFSCVSLRSVDTLLYDPDYVFSRKDCYPADERKERKPVQADTQERLVSSEDLGLLSDGFSDEEDAKLAAMIAAPDLPLIQRVETGKGQIPVYVPVLYDDDDETYVPESMDAMRVERETGVEIESQKSLLVGPEAELRRLEEEGSVAVSEGLEIDDEDYYEDEAEGYEELPVISDTDTDIDDDAVFV